MGDAERRAELGTSLGAQVTELVEAGLPLAPGLRAMASELGGPGGRQGRALRRVAERLDRGVSLDEAMQAERRGFPPHLHALVQAGLRTGRLAAALGEFLAIERNRTELRRQLRLSLTYPVLLCAIGFMVLAILCSVVVPQFAKIFRDFDTQLPPLTEAVIFYSGYSIWPCGFAVVLPFLAIYVIRTTGRPAEAQGFVDRIPVFGAIGRWSSAAEFRAWSQRCWTRRSRCRTCFALRPWPCGGWIFAWRAARSRSN